MTLELHIWGPSFGLPSIDPQCLAAIAYLSRALPQGEWAVIASSDPGICPDNELPALRNGGTWVSGFRNIVEYLRQYSAGQWDLDEELGEKERAETIAYSSFIESKGHPLLDLSLYVSSENYTNVTRGAYSDMLQWPNTWITPPNIREIARKRSEHLGLSSLDVDMAAEQDGETGAKAGAPKSLLLRQRETVTSLLGKPIHKNQIRLSALADDFYEPLEALLRGKRYFLTRSQPSSLDCLALGYLSLMLIPELPHSWTKDFMRAKYPKLTEFTERESQSCFGPAITVRETLLPQSESRSKAGVKLPWQAPEPPSISAVGSNVLSGIANSVPFVRQLRTDRQLRKAAADLEGGEEDSEKIKALAQARSRETYSQIASVVTVLGLFASYLFYEGIVELPGRGQEEERKPDLGEAGAFLSSL